MVGFQLKAVALLAVLATTQCLANDDSPVSSSQSPAQASHSATLLQSSTVASKYGISGPYWYAGGATIQIIIFSILSIMLKTRAPGAKTFLQVSKVLF